MAARGIKAIAPVPTANDFLDIVLSGTQRRTPTQIHKGFKISRIRSFYMRKVKFTQQTFDQKLGAILDEFPILDNLHPFLSSLLNVLYDKNHYKLALGQLNTCRHLIDQVGKDYLRLLKFGDSMYRCKQLKRAAFGRMATIMRRQKDSLAYLEQVRQHMSRLPAIDPTTRTLLVCGYPNVGKSSFINKITRADVDVQPYAFTTKSLFVGHMDYKYLRWQAIDTPGLLDAPLEDMNTIEMQSITALAHLRSCILFFMDLSEQCGYTVEAQCKLYQSIKPLFANKPVFIVINKIDVTKPEDLEPSRAALLDTILKGDNVQMLKLSCLSEEGIMEVRNTACEALLAHRVEGKEKTKRVEAVASRIRVAMPRARDEVERTPFIPAGVATRPKYDKNDPARRLLEVDLEEESGGAGVHSVDLKKNYLLKKDEWKYDVVPEVMDGKNIADFVDPDIFARLEELEKEEEKLEADGFYASDEDLDSDEEAITTTAKDIRSRKDQIRLLNTQKNKLQNKPVIPRANKRRTLSEMTADLRKSGIDPSTLEERAKLLAAANAASAKIGKRKRSENAMDVDDEDAWEDDDAIETDQAGPAKSKKARATVAAVTAGKRQPVTDRRKAGIKESQLDEAKKMRRLAERTPNRMARAGEADHRNVTKMPKHLFAGKRKSGKTQRR
ncbi:uncharacterized protein L969DRAFT_43817 [Mixia osmundae IAM 14324]|uniref:Nucleolar GTP-binding protein 1 n=1 Tax=Mixia osmundae (strain CBS 9802 / IAM 14324 / JCM 22182 / KY 12970) TaxID=764103 RepID=G7E3S2_MIXOS|nr:uncharacterized protein L969DRAFT_43817 [Mixia osmundae IAM 14324]KEI41928.1 hypothetical protein L969DRAFT_43817 [Mixia osmundae IAM 14324]GAA97482.1 hypothetical protein E5Q_04160 [Mixia osmundae IAM 14324]